MHCFFGEGFVRAESLCLFPSTDDNDDDNGDDCDAGNLTQYKKFRIKTYYFHVLSIINRLIENSE